MALTHAQQGGRAAFTLVELLVVIGLMAVLATISVAGYNAASRGMADRGVIQSTVSIMRVAQQTCQIDRVPTKVLFFNQRLTDEGDEDDATLYQGTAIAIKQAGRLTLSPTKTGLLIDEFADWNQSYPTKGTESAPNIRIYRMKAREEQLGIDDCSVLVRPYVSSYELKDYMIQSNQRMNDWCSRHDRQGNNLVWGFSPRSDTGGWKTGEPYGIEIARIDLPKGYIFGRKKPSSSKKLEAASDAATSFDPEDVEPKPSSSVTVSIMRPSGDSFTEKPVDTVTEKMLRDKDN